MRFHTLDQAPEKPDDVLFVQSMCDKVVALVLFVTLAVYSFAVQAVPELWPFDGEGLPGYVWNIIGVAFVLLSAVALRVLRAVTGSGRFVLRFDGHRVLVHCRSYLNCHFDDHVPVVVELDPQDVMEVRKCVVRSLARSAGSEVDHKRDSTFLEIELRATDLSPLSQMLSDAQEDRSEERPVARSRFVHEPVKLQDSNVLCVEWRGEGGRVVPSIERALEELRSCFPVGEARFVDMTKGSRCSTPG